MDAKLDQYVMVRSLDEATSLLAEQGKNARVVGGGITMNELAFKGLLGNAKILVDISNLGLDYVRHEGGAVRIGAGATFTALRESKAFAGPEYGALQDALVAIRPVQIRNLATVGGSICSGLPTLDFPIAAIAHDSSVKIASKRGERKVPLNGFFLDYFVTDLRDGELVTEVEVPTPKPGTVSSFLKFETTSIDLAILNVAVRFTVGRDKKAEDVRVALGGIGRVPVRANGVEQRLTGTTLSKDSIEAACEGLVKEVNPPGDFRASSTLRRHLSKVLTKRALLRALERSGKSQ